MASSTLRTLLRSAAVVGALTFGSVAGAQPIVYFDRATFISALTTTQSNDLNAIANGGTTISFGTLGTGTLTNATVQGGQIVNPGGAGSSYTFSITFSQLINAFGGDFFASPTTNSGLSSATFTFFNGSTQIGQQAGYTVAGNFIGAFATNPNTNLTAFNRVQISEVPITNNGATTFSRVDNLIVGVVAPSATVPEPTTIALMATGLLAVGGVARRKRARG